ncbi:MAG TPA: hypothetical protein VFW76_03280 [Ktedonobacterales bacterium]|nr:hypothetical protein [Ktedonobacterales bacterium]
MSDGAVDIPVACSLTEAELEVRGGENAELFAHARAVEELADGYRFAFPAEDDGIPALLQFILAERACCPFFTFELQFPSPHQVVWVVIRGNEEAKGIVCDGLVPKVTAAR